MSSEPSQHKIGLDARAAELKEKLLRSRSQIQNQRRASPGQSSPQVAKPIPAVDVGTPSKVSIPGLSSPAVTKPPPGTVPHQPPQLPASASFRANADDIAALISSISSAAPDAPSVDSSSTNGLSKDAQQKAPVGHAPALERPPLPPKPAPKTSAPTTATASTPKKQAPGVPSQQQPMSKPNQPPSQKPIQQLNGTVRTAGAPPKAPTQEPSPGAKSAQTAPSNTKAAAPTAGVTTKAATSAMDGNSEKAPVAKTETDAQQLRSIPKPNSSSSEKPRTTNPTLTNPSPSGLDRRSGTTPSIVPPILVASIAPKSMVSNGTGSAPRAASSHRTGHPEATASPDSFNLWLDEAPDLREFLEMTDYFNVDTRARRLDRFRRAKALAAQKKKIEEEERKLLEEEELEMGLHRSSVARFSSAAPPGIGPETNSTPTPVTPLLLSTASGAGGTKDTPVVSPGLLKRPHEGDGADARQEKVPRREEPARSRSLDRKSREVTRRDTFSDVRRDTLPEVRRDAHSDRPDPRPRAPSPGERYRPRPPADDDYQGRRRYDNYPGDRYRDSERRISYPIPVDLGRKGDTRFFILKSFNDENVRRCMEENLWTTQIQNGEILSEAYAQCRNVILFFSVNRSKAFQGYARMVSAPSPDVPRPTFVKGIHWDTSDAFRVQWLSKTTVDFYRIGHLKNAFNEHLPVLVGKDGQEIEPECGAALLREMEDYALDWERDGHTEGYYASRRESGGGRFYNGRK